jgi:hypothetical protein
MKTEFDYYVAGFGDYATLLTYLLKAGIPYSEAQVYENDATDKSLIRRQTIIR